jgi:hypothetical protein
MLYSLPNGRTIEISLEEYLNLTDQDIQDIIASNSGYNVSSPFFNSSISQKLRLKTDTEIDQSIDYSEEFEDNPLSLGINEIINTLDILSSDPQCMPEILIEPPHQEEE